MVRVHLKAENHLTISIFLKRYCESMTGGLVSCYFQLFGSLWTTLAARKGSRLLVIQFLPANVEGNSVPRCAFNGIRSTYCSMGLFAVMLL